MKIALSRRFLINHEKTLQRLDVVYNAFSMVCQWIDYKLIYSL